MKRILLLGLIVILLGGCTTWTQVQKSNQQHKSGAYSVILPDGWMQWEAGRNKYMVAAGATKKNIAVERIQVTKDGPQLQYIDIIYFKKEDAFPHVKKKLTAGMLPSEVADYEIAELKARTGIAHMKVLKNAPAVIAGNPGFMLHVRYRNSGGLRIDEVVYGFNDDNGLYTVTYRAPVLHYFDRDYETFKSVVASFGRA